MAKIWLIVTFVMLVVIPPYVGEYMRNEKKTTIDEFAKKAQDLNNKGEYEAAIAMFDFVTENSSDTDEINFQKQKEEAEQNKNAFWTKTKNLGYGAATGEIYDTYSLFGCIFTDLFIIGDIRDSVKQTYYWYTGNENYDELQHILSGVIIGCAAACQFEIGIPASIFKTFSRVMTSGMKKVLKMIVEEYRTFKKSERFEKLCGSVYKIYGRIGIGVKYVLNISPDLKTIDEMCLLIEKFGNTAFVLMLSKGVDCLSETFNTAAKLGKKAFVFTMKYPIIAAKIIKITKKLAWDHFAITLMAAAELLSLVPFWHTLYVCLAIWTWMYLDRVMYFMIGPKRIAVA